jgi:hypothetical protein
MSLTPEKLQKLRHELASVLAACRTVYASISKCSELPASAKQIQELLIKRLEEINATLEANQE